MSERKRRFKVFSQVFFEKTCGFLGRRPKSPFAMAKSFCLSKNLEGNLKRPLDVLGVEDSVAWVPWKGGSATLFINDLRFPQKACKWIRFRKPGMWTNCKSFFAWECTEFSTWRYFAENRKIYEQNPRKISEIRAFSSNMVNINFFAAGWFSMWDKV